MQYKIELSQQALTDALHSDLSPCMTIPPQPSIVFSTAPPIQLNQDTPDKMVTVINPSLSSPVTTKSIPEVSFPRPEHHIGEIGAIQNEGNTSARYAQPPSLASNSRIRFLKQVSSIRGRVPDELQEGTEIPVISGHFAGPAIALRRPVPLNLVSINAAAASSLPSLKREALRAPRRRMHHFFPSPQGAMGAQAGEVGDLSRSVLH